MKGWFIMPKTGSPRRISAISVPQAGMPEMKDLVPSIGSSTQTYSASGALLAELLADDAVVRERATDEGAHRGLGGVIGGRDRVEAARPTLVLDAQRGAEERQDGFARHRRQLIDKGRKIDRRHVHPCLRVATLRRRTRPSAAAVLNRPGPVKSRY